jgi:DNA-directed RNA polymerase subunit RPC12/RpoP
MNYKQRGTEHLHDSDFIHKTHAIIVCHKCGQYLLAKMDQKTRQCPYCETKLILNKTKIIASAKTAREASKIIRTMKDAKKH